MYTVLIVDTTKDLWELVSTPMNCNSEKEALSLAGRFLKGLSSVPLYSSNLTEFQLQQQGLPIDSLGVCVYSPALPFMAVIPGLTYTDPNNEKGPYLGEIGPF
jgi:hypothetical protein